MNGQLARGSRHSVLAGCIDVAPRRLTAIPLRGPSDDRVKADGDEIVFQAIGWYEILLEVHWDASARKGPRFSHTKLPESQPLHSEEIEAAVLADLSDGAQLLRGNTMLGPGYPDRLALEVWQNHTETVSVLSAAITVRLLPGAAH